MQPVLYGYFPILVFMVIAGAIALAMVGGSLLAARQKPYPEKVSAYECGFEPFDDARRRFDVRFYLVAILFIIFCFELGLFLLIYPWTDSWTDNPADRSIAQSRAVRAREFLLANGIDAGKIRTTFQASGGYLADNATPAGRALNRRVEIEANGLDTSPLMDQLAAADGSLQ